MRKTSIVYVDDMKMGIVSFEKAITDFESIELKASFKNAKQALEYCGVNPPDIVVTDISMPGHDGLWLADGLRKLGIPFAFLSSHNDKAFQSYQLQALHYLSKPVTSNHISELMERYQRQVAVAPSQTNKPVSSIPKRIFVNTQKQILIIQLSEVVYVNAEGSYTYFHLLNGNVVVSGKTMKTYSDILLANPDFVKIHRAYIINQSNLDSINKKKLKMTFHFRNGQHIVLATFRKGEWMENMDTSKA